jgi:predicted acyl esterase
MNPRSAIRMTAFALLLAVVALINPLGAQERVDVRAGYAKTEHRIAMRDGVRLFTGVYSPRDTSQRFPIMLIRTPYSVAPYGSDVYKETLGPSPLFAKEGYIFVYQDVRGRYMSEGEYVNAGNDL